MGKFNDLEATFDPGDNRRRGKQFEQVCQWFLENDPTYQPLLRRVWLWDDWPGRRGIDAGIDLVAEDRDGKLWAIQAKAYAPSHSISKRDVDKFVAESSRSMFTHRLLIATTDTRHHIATRLMDDLGIPFIGLTQLREADDYLDWPVTAAALRPAKRPKPKKPWNYQRTAINDVVKGFEDSDRGQLIMACGTGKTLTAWFITERLEAKRVLVLVPSLSLLKQTMREWQTANPNTPFAALPVCSDETVGLGEDAAVSHTSDVGVPVTTDPAAIAEFLRKRSGLRVVFSTYHSSPRIAAAFKMGRVPEFDLVVADEAHRCAGAVSSDFATILDPEEIKARRRIFMTATPRYFTGRILREAKDADYEIASMDDRTRFGGEFHRLSFSEAIDRKLLTDYQVAIIGVDEATYLDWAERGTLVTIDGERTTNARSLAGQIGLAKAMRKFDLHRVISFHGRVKAAREFATSMPAVLDWMPVRHRPKGSLWSTHASGEMSAGDRATLIQHLTRLDDGERGLLANARCLAEGVDVPALDGVAFIDPRRAEVDIVQAVGRAIRKSETKTIGTIVIPVFIDTQADAQAALDSSAFKAVWDVIKALRAHDTELGEQLDALRREMGRKGGGKPHLPSKILVDVPATVGEDFVNAFRVHMVDATTAPWEFWFGLLEGYVAEHGHARLPITLTVGENRLGVWVAKQRSHRNKGRLQQARQRRLEELPGWSWNPRDDLWEEGFAILHDYVMKSGTAVVPKDCIFNGFQIGAWITTQRSAHKGGELPVGRIQRLEALPGWTWNTRNDKWLFGYEQLEKYVAEHGHTRPAALEKYEGFRLGQWVAQQRYHRNKSNLDAARVRLLEEFPDWIWDAVIDQWEEGFRHLQEYVQQCGGSLVSQSFRAADGYKLGQWVTIQRTVYRDGGMSEERRSRLGALPDWSWDPRNSRWDYWYSALTDYVRVNGSARVPRSGRGSGEDDKLANWVQTQRTWYAKGSLRADRAARLEALPGWVWDPHEAAWEEGFAKVQEYAAIHGDCLVPHSVIQDDYRLGGWVNSQRTNYVKGSLRPDYAKRLESLPGWIWDVNESKWDEGFRHLVDYMNHHNGSTPPPKYRQGDYSLGSWVGTQRTAYRTGRLRDDRARRLEALSSWTWDSKADQWERTYNLLKQYSDLHGTARVPHRYCVSGIQVGSWIGTQKSAYAKGRLDSDRQRKLEKLPEWTWSLSEDIWDERYAVLAKFAVREGHARVPQKHVEQGIRLGLWVSVQRREALANVMPPERRQRLESLPGWSWNGGASIG